MTKDNALDKNQWDWCPVKDLTIIWPDAQRPIIPGHLKALCAAFDPDLFDPVHVSAIVKTPASRHIIDGGHRVKMVEQLFGTNEQVPCIIHNDCTSAADAARIFRDLNRSRRAQTAVSDFKVAVTAGSEVHVAIDKIVRKAGLHIYQGGENNYVSAVGALLLVYSRYGSRALDRAFHILKKTWPDDRHAFQGAIIIGCASLLFDYPAMDQERLIGRINKKFSPGTLLAAARALRQASANPIAQEVKQVLINHYNSGLREAQKLHPAENSKEAASKASFRGYSNGAASESDLPLAAKSH